MAKARSTVDFQVGKIYPFVINRVDNDYCELLDTEGFPCYLQGTNRYNLSKGQHIQCKILDYKPMASHPRIALVETDDIVKRDVLVGETLIGQILKEMDVKWNTKSFINMLLMIDSGNSYESECNRWVQGLMESKSDLVSIRKDCFDFMELSRFLKMCKMSDREFYQQRITSLLELMGYYIKAQRYKENGQSELFIDSLFEKLSKSGYVYHPTKNFNIMACLFLDDNALMEEKVPHLFNILRQWELDQWLKEPFRGMLIKVLEVYVNETIWNLDRKENNRELVNNIIQALSIQFLLIGNRQDVEDVDIRLNISRLCALATYVSTRSPKDIINMTMSNLLNSQNVRPYFPLFSLSDTGSDIIPFFIDNAASVADTRIKTTSTFIHGKAKLVVSDEGIALYSGNVGANSKGVLPKDLGLWANMQVYVDKKTVRNTLGRRTMTVFEGLWRDIEQEIFREKETTTKTVVTKKRKHMVDDIVKIIIVKNITYGLFGCKIVDEIGGEGVIWVDQIVPYSVAMLESDFLSERGDRLVFEAKIIDTQDDGRFVFSMQQIIKDLISEGYYSYEDRIVCSIGSDQVYNGRVPAISREGIGISLGGLNNLNETFRKGDVVVAEYESTGMGTFHINANIIERCEKQDFYLPDAFRHLMRYVALPDEEISVVQEEDIQESDKILDVTYMKEIIRAIDRMSAIDNEYIKSYNYLGFARILCLMIGWEQQAAYYKGRMDLIAMLYEFAVNDYVDEAKLELLDNANADMFNSNALLKERYEQLRIVSFLGKPEHQQELLERYTQSSGMHQTLASLVLGYNIMKAQGMESQANDVHNKIKQTLRLKGFESHLKTYGSGVETLTVEYKQSIVYVPEDMKNPNLPMQTRNILRVIASFLNTNGGTLYLGVNDMGAGVGLESDLMYAEFKGDKDKYQRYISDKIAMTWNNMIATCVKHIDYDADNHDKDVLIVTVEPYPYGVEYEGKWWVRTASSKRGLTREEFEWYNNNNRQLASSKYKPLPTQTVENETAAPAEEEPTTNDAPTAQPMSMLFKSSVTAPPEVSQPAVELPDALQNRNLVAYERKEDEQPSTLSTSIHAEDLVKTSRIRFNNLEGNDAPYPIAFFKFMLNDNFCKLTSYDYEPELLTLAILDDDSNGYLILGYADGTIAKARVDELLAKNDYVNYKRNSASKLIFASIAREGDAVMSITKESKSAHRIMVRVDSLDKIDECKIADKGMCPYNEEMICEVMAMDIIPAEDVNTFANITDLDARSLGNPYAKLPKAMDAKIKAWGFGDFE